MELVFRPFQPDDMDGLYFLDRRCHPTEQWLPYSRLLGSLLEKDVSAIVAVEPHQAFSSRLAGALLVRSEPWHGRLTLLALMVDPAARRLGVGRRLLAWAERIGRGSGFRELAIAQEDERPETVAALERLGFDRAEARMPAYRNGGDAPRWVRALLPPEGP